MIPKTWLWIGAFLLCGCDDEHDDAGDGHGSTGHSHATDAGHTETSSHDDADGSTGPDDAADAYCDCVFANCHEPYHAKWGEDEIASAMACRSEAAGLPQNGAPTMEGNFLECRQAHCEAAATNPATCDAALGEAPCE